DEETIQVMLRVANREKQRWLNVKSFDNFPCVDLRTIDGLWVKYSNGRFGFSVQKRIYQSLGANEIAFGDRVGWRRKGWRLGMGFWKYYDELTFDITAPEAHLPGCISLNLINTEDIEDIGVLDAFIFGTEAAKWAERFFSRVETCGL
ncbi:MAG: GUN4 domain-containing protein, partial [Sphaerospermopsis kisseleviana]